MSNISEYITNNGGTLKAAVRVFVVSMMKSDFVQKVTETLATRFLLIVLGLGISILVARTLGPAELGLYALASSVAAVGVQLGNLGLHASNTYYVAKDRKCLPALVGNSLLASLMFGGFSGIVAIAIFSMWPHLAPVHGSLLILTLLWIPFGLAYLLLQNLLIGIQEIRTYNKMDITINVLSITFMGLLILAGVVTVEAMFTIGLVTLIIGVALILHSMKLHMKQFPSISLVLFRRNLQYGFKAYASAIMAFLVLRVDIFMVNYYLGAKDAGLYSVAANMANMINVYPVIVGTIFFPKLCALTDWTNKIKLVRDVSYGMVSVMIPTIAAALLLADLVVTLLYGKVYLSSVEPFKWLMPGVFILSIESIVRRLLISDGYKLEVVLAWVIILPTNIVLNYILIPKMGMVGASIASSLSFFLLALITSIITIRFVSRIRYQA